MVLKKLFSAILSVALALTFPGLATAQEATAEPSFALELNGLEDTGDGRCGLLYVVTNKSDIPLDRAAFEMAIFDGSGAVTGLLTFNFGELIANKVLVKKFYLPETSCGSISRIIVNTLVSCTRADTGEEAEFCMTSLTASSRTDIDFSI